MELQAARIASGKTQAQVAKEANINVQQYQNYEYGERRPRVDIAIRIAKALDSTVEKLFAESDTPTE